MTSPASSGLRVAARRAARLSSVAAVAVPRTSASDSQRTVNPAAAEKRPAGSLDRPSPGGALLIALRLLPAENSTREALGLGSPHPRMRSSSALPRCEAAGAQRMRSSPMIYGLGARMAREEAKDCPELLSTLLSRTIECWNRTRRLCPVETSPASDAQRCGACGM